MGDAMLSPTALRRSGTLTRPQGPRALGSRSPAASPCGLSKSMSAISRPPSRAADENDPFTASRSGTRKRSYDENLEHSSSSSKRPVPDSKSRPIADLTTPTSRTASQPRQGHADPLDVSNDTAVLHLHFQLIRVSRLSRPLRDKRIPPRLPEPAACLDLRTPVVSSSRVGNCRRHHPVTRSRLGRASAAYTGSPCRLALPSR